MRGRHDNRGQLTTSDRSACRRYVFRQTRSKWTSTRTSTWTLDLCGGRGSVGYCRRWQRCRCRCQRRGRRWSQRRGRCCQRRWCRRRSLPPWLAVQTQPQTEDYQQKHASRRSNPKHGTRLAARWNSHRFRWRHNRGWHRHRGHRNGRRHGGARNSGQFNLRARWRHRSAGKGNQRLHEEGDRDMAITCLAGHGLAHNNGKAGWQARPGRIERRRFVG